MKQTIQTIQTIQAPAAIGPYSQAIRAGSVTVVSGQLGIDPSTGNLVPGGVKEQTAQALDNVDAILRAAGRSLGEVAKTTVFLADMSDFAAMNEVYARYFTEPYPARSTIAVKALPKGGVVEIEVIVF
jgi:2-iminobutanoate/2-iminopropanoate deaminase